MVRYIAGIVLGLIYLVLILGNFITDPVLLYIPASMLVSFGLLWAVPVVIRKYLHPEHFGLIPSLGISLGLTAVLVGLLSLVTTEYLFTYAIVCLTSLNLVLFLISVVTLRKEIQTV